MCLAMYSLDVVAPSTRAGLDPALGQSKVHAFRTGERVLEIMGLLNVSSERSFIKKFTTAKETPWFLWWFELEEIGVLDRRASILITLRCFASQILHKLV